MTRPDPLSRYRAKRDFARTAEPPGEVPNGEAPNGEAPNGEAPRPATGEVASGAAGQQASAEGGPAPASGYESGTGHAGDSREAGVDPYSGHNFGGSSPDWVDEEPEEDEDAWQLTGR